MPNKLESTRIEKPLNIHAEELNSSIKTDSRMYREDITGSMAHAAMLGKCGILPQEDAQSIITGLSGILADIDSGKLKIDMDAEDIHMYVEAELTRRLGSLGKKLHTARSRNDQVAVDVRLYLRNEIDVIEEKLVSLISVLNRRAEVNKAQIMPGYTHMQRAQPITLGHELLAYAMMFMRDYSRLEDTKKRMNFSPLGACALAGTGYPTDRDMTAKELGFDDICRNSLDAVSDRDFAIELCSDIAVIMMHLSRFSEELILWSSWEFGFIEMDDAFSTSSSIMPQKKNPDMAELIRGKTGRTYGNLMNLLTIMKGLPLAYNRDMQEDKQAVFDSIDTVIIALDVYAPMVDSFRVRGENMLKAAYGGFINATECADYLTRKGMPFRDAYHVLGSIVAYCIGEGFTLDTLPLEKYRSYSELFEKDIYDAVNLENCVNIRKAAGSANAHFVEQQCSFVSDWLTDVRKDRNNG